MSVDKVSKKKLIHFYKTDKAYYSLMEKKHDKAYYEPVLRVLKQHEVSFKGKRTLDVGSGTGSFIQVLRKVYEVPFEAVGTDVSPIGKSYHQDKKIKFVLADAHNLPFKSECFDFVFSLDVLEHLLNPQEAVEEMCRVAKKGGLIVVRTRNYCSPLTQISLSSIIDLIRGSLQRKSLKEARKLKPKFSSQGGDKDATAAICINALKTSFVKQGGELLKVETWTKGGAWKILNCLPIINLLGSMCLLSVKKGRENG